MIIKALKGWQIFGIRHLQYFLIFIGLSIGYAAIRVNLSIAIIGMTDKNNTNSNFETFTWDITTKQTVLGAILWGYVVGQIPGGLLAKRFGSRHLLAFSVLSTSVLTILTPILTTLWNWKALLILRILIGFFQGTFLPSVILFETKWSPKNEIARISAIMMSGVGLGTFMTMALSGMISLKFGWPYVFYLPGIFGIIWAVFWYILSADSPAQHSRISEAEKNFIQNSLGHSKDSHLQKIPIPWQQIFTSVPVYAATLAYCANVWIYVLLITESPIYLNGMFDITLDNNGFLASIPFLSRLIFTYVLVGLEYVIIEKKILSIKGSRRFFTIIGLIIPAVCIAILPFIPQQYMYLSILALLIANGTNAASTFGCSLAAIDMAPNHASAVLALISTVGAVFSILAPVLVGIIVTNEKNQEEWQIIFISTSVFFVISCLIFLIFGSNEVQPWNNMKEEDH